MKKTFLAVVITGCIAFMQQPVQAQSHKVVYIRAVPEWVPSKGYWVVESNIKTPRQHTVYFYNDNNELIYTEKLSGVKLNMKKNKVKMQLKQALEEALLTWEKKREPATNQYLVVNQMKKG